MGSRRSSIGPVGRARSGRPGGARLRPIDCALITAAVALVTAALAGGVTFYLGYRFGRSGVHGGASADTVIERPREWDEARRRRQDASGSADTVVERPREWPAARKPPAPEPEGAEAKRPDPQRSRPSDPPPIDARPVAATRGNFLDNPGFEEGSTGWKWLDWSSNWAPFDVVQGTAAGGDRSARLAVRGAPGDPETRVWGVVQEIAPEAFPERISGRYRIDRWEPGAARKMYLQAVVISLHPEGPLPSTQVRYVLEGVTEPPYRMSNARYRFANRRPAPPQGEWIEFSLPVKRDFLDLWGKIPPPGTALRVLFEARYDDKPRTGMAAADVYYDDLFVGVP